MPELAIAVANHLLDLSGAVGEEVDPMKMQKLVFFSHGWALAILDHPLIAEPVEAWKFGPVIRAVYTAFREFGSKPITAKAQVTRHIANGFRFEVAEVEDQQHKDIVQRVWDVHHGYSAIQLSNLTHLPGTPWDQMNKQFGGKLPDKTLIPSGMMRDYFRSLLAK